MLSIVPETHLHEPLIARYATFFYIRTVGVGPRWHYPYLYKIVASIGGLRPLLAIDKPLLNKIIHSISYFIQKLSYVFEGLLKIIRILFFR